MKKNALQNLYAGVSAVPAIVLMIHGLLLLHAYLILGAWPRPYLNDPKYLSDSILWQFHFYTTIFSTFLLWVITIIIWPIFSVYLFKKGILSKKVIIIASIIFILASVILFSLLQGSTGNWLAD
ncbi:MAG: hypothetical protein ABH826_04415 [Patescibacteria group bacterium]|nr:hypothetical protein [Patescibacteria group bacterium]